jgi:hypothetical protein
VILLWLAAIARRGTVSSVESLDRATTAEKLRTAHNAHEVLNPPMIHDRGFSEVSPASES